MEIEQKAIIKKEVGIVIASFLVTASAIIALMYAFTKAVDVVDTPDILRHSWHILVVPIITMIIAGTSIFITALLVKTKGIVMAHVATIAILSLLTLGIRAPGIIAAALLGLAAAEAHANVQKKLAQQRTIVVTWLARTTLAIVASAVVLTSAALYYETIAKDLTEQDIAVPAYTAKLLEKPLGRVIEGSLPGMALSDPVSELFPDSKKESTTSSLPKPVQDIIKKEGRLPTEKELQSITKQYPEIAKEYTQKTDQDSLSTQAIQQGMTQMMQGGEGEFMEFLYIQAQQETDATIFDAIMAYTNHQIREMIKPYANLIPAIATILYLMIIGTFKGAARWVATGLSWLILKILTATPLVNKKLKRVQAEVLEL